MVGLCETWFTQHLSLTFKGYNFIRTNRQQGREAGVLLAQKEDLMHSEIRLLRWAGGCLEIAATRVDLQRGWATVAIYYNPGGAATYREL